MTAPSINVFFFQPEKTRLWFTIADFKFTVCLKVGSPEHCSKLCHLLARGFLTHVGTSREVTPEGGHVKTQRVLETPCHQISPWV